MKIQARNNSYVRKQAQIAKKAMGIYKHNLKQDVHYIYTPIKEKGVKGAKDSFRRSIILIPREIAHDMKNELIDYKHLAGNTFPFPTSKAGFILMLIRTLLNF